MHVCLMSCQGRLVTRAIGTSEGKSRERSQETGSENRRLVDKNTADQSPHIP